MATNWRPGVDNSGTITEATINIRPVRNVWLFTANDVLRRNKTRPQIEIIINRENKIWLEGVS